MNLNRIAGGIITAINCDQSAIIAQSTGYTTNGDGSQVPVYGNLFAVQAQIQALSGSDLRQIDGLNLQSTYVAVYLNSNWAGVVRVARKGGDLLSVPSGPYTGDWLLTQVLENWSGWTKFAATLQNEASSYTITNGVPTPTGS